MAPPVCWHCLVENSLCSVWFWFACVAVDRRNGAGVQGVGAHLQFFRLILALCANQAWDGVSICSRTELMVDLRWPCCSYSCVLELCRSEFPPALW